MGGQRQAALSTERRTVHEIFESVIRNGHEELHRSSRALAFSGFAGGITMGLTGMAVAIVRALLGEGTNHELVAYLFYPVGFIAVIIGRAQLFTENTLYPVVLVLEDPRHLANMLRLWAVVFTCNVAGAAAFGAVMMKTSAGEPKVAEGMVVLGLEMAA